MLTVAPSGMEKLHTFGEMPSLSVQVLKFTGMAAELEARVKLVSMPSRFFRKNVTGLSRAITAISRP